MSTIKRVLVPLSLAYALSGCVVIPTAFTVASLTVDNLSYMVSGKSISDHALSTVAGQDCSFGNVIKGNDICLEAGTPDAPVVAAAVTTPKTTDNQAERLIHDERLVYAERLARTRALAALPVINDAAPLPIGGQLSAPPSQQRSGIIAMTPHVPAALPPRKPSQPQSFQLADASQYIASSHVPMVDMAQEAEVSMLDGVMRWFR